VGTARASATRVCSDAVSCSMSNTCQFAGALTPLPSIRQHLSCDGCLEVKREDYQNCSLLYYVLQLCTVISTLMSAVLTGDLGRVRLSLSVRFVLFLN